MRVAEKRTGQARGARRVQRCIPQYSAGHYARPKPPRPASPRPATPRSSQPCALKRTVHRACINNLLTHQQIRGRVELKSKLRICTHTPHGSSSRPHQHNNSRLFSFILPTCQKIIFGTIQKPSSKYLILE